MNIHGNKKPLEYKFWNKVKKTRACWFWIGFRSPKGYGILSNEGKLQRAHRVSWVIHNGTIPKNILVCHSCDNPSCVNPNHLWLGTTQENTADRNAKGRQDHPTGIKHPMSKLTEENVREIRNLKGKIVQKEIARKFNVSEATISQIYHRLIWSHLS